MDIIQEDLGLVIDSETQQDDSLQSTTDNLENENKLTSEVQADEEQIELNQEQFKRLKLVLEAMLMASDKPLSLKQLADIINEHNEDHNIRVRDKVKFSRKHINLALDELNMDFENRAIELKFLGAGYRIQTKAEYAVVVQRLWQEKPTKYSKATLETLAIIAYRQPITRGEIEHIRGVAVSSHIIRNLQDRDWIKVVGYRELPGKPAVYATTQQFLFDLNLSKLEDLPTLADIKEIKQDLFSGLELVPTTDESEIEAEAASVE